MLDEILQIANGIRENQFERMIWGGFCLLLLLTIVAWRFMVPFLLAAGLVAGYLRYSRPKDSL